MSIVSFTVLIAWCLLFTTSSRVLEGLLDLDGCRFNCDSYGEYMIAVNQLALNFHQLTQFITLSADALITRDL